MLPRLVAYLQTLHVDAVWVSPLAVHQVLSVDATWWLYYPLDSGYTRCCTSYARVATVGRLSC